MSKEKQRNKFIDKLFLAYMHFKQKIKYDLESCNSESIILHYHLGLGDNIVCNGLVNKLSSQFGEIHLPIKKPYGNMIRQMFSYNNKLKFFEVSYSNSTYDIFKYSLEKNIDILRIGFEKQKNNPFNSWFYEQLGFDYSDSFSLFKIELNNKKPDILYDHLINYYHIGNESYNLVHNESHNKIFDLKIKSDNKIIFVTKESDLFNNIFFYSKLIKNAEEIHCINSSFLHLVERMPNKNKLFYHDIRKSNFKLSENWKTINY